MGAGGRWRGWRKHLIGLAFGELRGRGVQLFSVSLNDQQNIGKGDRNEEILEAGRIGDLAFFYIEATGFEISIERFNPGTLLIACRDHDGFVQVGDNGDWCIALRMPPDEEMAWDAMFIGEEDVEVEII